MANIQNILQGLKDSIQDMPYEEQKIIPKQKPIKRKKKTHEEVSFSNKEIEELEKELLGSQAVYNEPTFTKQSKILKTAAIPKKTEETAKEQIVGYEKYDDSRLIQELQEIKNRLSRLDKKIEINAHTKEANTVRIDEAPQPIEIVKLMIAQTSASELSRYQLQTRDGIEEIALGEYYEMSKFVSMLQQYRYAMVIDQTIDFDNKQFSQYRDKITIVSQNILANSFRFFEKSDILNETIALGEKIKSSTSFTTQAIDELEVIFENIKEAFFMNNYQQNFYFAELLNDRGFVLNAITLISEMLGEYLVESARKLSVTAEYRIQNHLDRIDLSRTTRKAYYNLHKSAKEFFKSHYGEGDRKEIKTFFPFKDSGNEEIEIQLTKLYRSNKRNKSSFFESYSILIDRVGEIRNDLAHGNNTRVYRDITKELKEILEDFKYLAIDKNFLQV